MSSQAEDAASPPAVGGPQKSARSASAAELRTLVRAGYPVVSIVTPEEVHALEIARDALAGDPGEVWRWSAAAGLLPFEIEGGSAIEGTENPAAALSAINGRGGRQILIALDLIDHLSDHFVIRAARDLITRFTLDQGGPGGAGHLIMIDHGGELPSSIAGSATTLDIPLPREDELEQILRRTLSRHHRQIGEIAIDITRGQLRAIVANLRGLTRDQAARVVAETVSADGAFDSEDLRTVIKAKRRLLGGAGALQFVERPADLSEVGGMRNLKKWLAQRRRSFDSDAQEAGLEPPRGVLMLGVQGTGKSLCARAIATAWDRPLLRLDAGSLYNSYIGESERRLRVALRQAEAMSPVVLWIDEIEKAFSSAASTSTDGGLSRRMFGALLTWMQEHTAPVFLVATANDIEALPPELLRKGRFDEIFFVDLPNAETRREILKIHLANRSLDPERFDLDRLSEASDGFSAAELEQAILSAMHEAFAEDSAAGLVSRLNTDRIEAAIRRSPPLSVTAAEKVRALQRWAEGRCVPAD